MINLYAREAPHLLFKTVTGETETVPSSTGVQQGCTLGPVCYSAGAADMLRAFREDPPVADAQILSYVDDVVVLLPPAEDQNPRAVEAVTLWLQQRMEPLGIHLNCNKSQVLFPPGNCIHQWPADDRAVLERTQLTVASSGVKIVGVPVGGGVLICCLP